MGGDMTKHLSVEGCMAAQMEREIERELTTRKQTKEWIRQPMCILAKSRKVGRAKERRAMFSVEIPT